MGDRSHGSGRPRPLPRRIARWLGADGNPLRRRTDRVESVLKVVLIVVFLLGGPLIAGLAGQRTETIGMRQVRQEQFWRQADAVLLRSAPRPYYVYGSMATFGEPGRWTTRSGATKVGEIPVQAGARAGSVVPIWLDRAGRVTGRVPLTRALVGLRTFMAVFLTLALLAVGLLFAGGLARWLLNRRRLIDWGIEWASFGPRWTKSR